jgi:hypothetical protein
MGKMVIFFGGFDGKMTFLGRKMAFLGGFTWENVFFFWVILSEKMVKSPTITNKNLNNLIKIPKLLIKPPNYIVNPR